MNPVTRKVLVVDDVSFNRKMIANVLGNQGFSVSSAATGESAVEQCQANDFDIVLMDVNLPGISGVEATRQIRRLSDGRGDRVAIVGLTAHASQKDRQTFLDAGMDECLAKPIDLARLLTRIDDLLAGKYRVNRERSGAVETNDPAAVSVLDIEAALKRLGSNRDLFQRFVQVFREDISGLLETARQAAETDNLKTLGDMAHRIRGMSANLNANALSASARKLEHLCEQALRTEAVEQFQQMKLALRALEEEFVARGLV